MQKEDRIIKGFMFKIFIHKNNSACYETLKSHFDSAQFFATVCPYLRVVGQTGLSTERK